jgi:hypothetical protein
MAPLAGISKAWIEAEAALPIAWELRGVVLGPRVADPVIDDAHWVAWARAKEGSKDETLPPAEGSGESPDQALNDLARRLRELRSADHAVE